MTIQRQLEVSATGSIYRDKRRWRGGGGESVLGKMVMNSLWDMLALSAWGNNYENCLTGSSIYSWENSRKRLGPELKI